MALIAWYKLDGNLIDSSGNGRTLTNNGSTSLAGTGKINTCANLDGTDDYLYFSSYSHPSNTPFTLSCWIKTSVSPSVSLGIISLGYYPVVVLTTGGQVRAWWYNNTTYPGINSTTTCNDNKWHHIGVTYDGAIVKLYIDGNLESSISETIVVCHASLRLGIEYNSGNKLFQGLIDDARFYSHPLTEKEIKELSKAKILHYQFNSPQEEPTQNLHPTAGCMHWINSGAWTLNLDATDVLPPFYSSLKIWSGEVTTQGNIHFGFNSTTVSPSTTYTISVWYRQNRAGSLTPYMRSSANNNSLGNFSYNGSPNSSTWPINTWIRITSTNTTASNETGIYLSNYIGTIVGDKIWYYGYQIEKKDHVTPYTNGSRSGIVEDISAYGNHGTIDLASSPDYRTIGKVGNGNFQFFQNWISLPNDLGYRDQFSAFGWFKSNGTPGDSFHILFGAQNLEMSIHSSGYLRTGLYTDARYVHNTTNAGLMDGNWHHLGMVYDGTYKYAYINGVLMRTDEIPPGTLITNFSNRRVGVYGTSTNYYTNGWHDDVRIYASALSEADVKEIYQTKAVLDKTGNLFLNDINNNAATTASNEMTLEEIFETNNMIKNGNFVNSSQNWVLQPFTSIVDERLVVDVSDTDTQPDEYINQTPAVSLTSGKKYYSYYDFTLKRYTSTNLSNVVYYGGAYGSPSVPTWSSAFIDKKQILSDHFTASTTTSDIRYGKVFNSIQHARYEIDNIHLICLTDVFGSGLEPTKIQMDNLYDEYKKFKIEAESILTSKDISEVGPTNGLIAWYPLDGDILDYSGNLKDGSLVSTPVITTGIGKYRAYDFNASGKRININIPQMSGNNYTFSAWVNKTANNGNLYNMFMGNSLPYFSYQDNNTFMFSANISGTQRSLYTSSTYSIGQWHHYVATYDGSMMKIFVNGVLDGQSSRPGTMDTLTTTFAIGDGNQATWYPFNGKVSDVRFYNRVLSELEIKTLYTTKRTPMQVLDGTVYIAGEFRND